MNRSAFILRSLGKCVCLLLLSVVIYAGVSLIWWKIGERVFGYEFDYNAYNLIIIPIISAIPTSIYVIYTDYKRRK